MRFFEENGQFLDENGLFSSELVLGYVLGPLSKTVATHPAETLEEVTAIMQRWRPFGTKLDVDSLELIVSFQECLDLVQSLAALTGETPDGDWCDAIEHRGEG